MVALIEAMKRTEIPVCAVMQDGCEYKIDWPAHWKIHKSEEHLEMSGAINALFKLYPNEPFYGMLDDHTRPLSEGWATKMQEVAGKNKIASGFNTKNRYHPVTGYMRINSYCMGGDLARELGWVWPDFVVHMYGDDVLEDIGYSRGILEHVHEAVFQPLLLRDGTLKPDENSKRLLRGVNYIAHDRKAYERWKAEWLMSSAS